MSKDCGKINKIPLSLLAANNKETTHQKTRPSLPV